jgi:hypothetical protein
LFVAYKKIREVTIRKTFISIGFAMPTMPNDVSSTPLMPKNVDDNGDEIDDSTIKSISIFAHGMNGKIMLTKRVR